MRTLVLLVAVGFLALARADELTDAEINEELLDEQNGIPYQSKDGIENSFDAAAENEPIELNEDFITKDARPGWGRVVRRVVRRVTRTGGRVVKRIKRTGKRVVKRVVRTGTKFVRRAYRKGKAFFKRLFSSCRVSKHYRRGKHVVAGKASVSCILETNPRKQAACWAPKIYYAIGELYKASSVDFFLPHVEMRSNSNRLLQRHCTVRNLKAVKNAYLTTRTPLRSATSTLPFFRGQHPRHSPIYTFYRTFKQGRDVFRDFFYWAFFPYNKGKRVCMGGAIKGRCIGKCRWFGHHVGDWEHVTIRLKNNLPLAMYISAHNFGGRYNYDNYRGTFRKGSALGEQSATVGELRNLAFGRPTRQSSTAAHGYPQRAVDGKRNGNYGSGSCTHTHWNHYPWWRVDLGSPQRIVKVSLSNRGDCCWNRLSRVEISVGNTDRSGANPRCYYHGGALGRYHTTAFTCYRPLVGRYVYVRRHGWGVLTLCEVEVYCSVGGNLALGRSTKQSSTGWHGYSQRAVDGKRNGNYGAGSCTHTHWNHYPWWRVDLGAPQRVFKVSLSNRGDCCWNRLSRVEISVGNTDRSGANPRCYYYGGALGRHQTATFTCYRPLVGRYVYVRRHGWGYLTLCEVEVFGKIGAQRPLMSRNIALSKPTRQESTRHGGHASRGVDGHAGLCAHSYSNYRPWWRVDLQHQRYVYKVAITNTKGRHWPLLRNFEIRVGAIDSPDGANILCTHKRGYFGWGTKSFFCSSPALGRYVYIRKQMRGSLILCEVKVYAILKGYSPLLTGNIAYGRGTRQISTGWGGHPSRAVDGNRHGNYYHRSCTHTHRHTNPWWRVDIGSPQEIAKVSLSNRADCCWNRLRRIEIRAGNHPSVHGSSLCNYYPGALSKGETKLFTCSNSVIGRYVFIRILAHEWLTICEVQVYAYKPGNLAFERPTRQSSTAAYGYSQRAVDGKRNGNYAAGSCTHTHWNHNPWWRVDLGSPQRVFKVSLSNRGDCCWNRLSRVEIGVMNSHRWDVKTRCYYYGGTLGRHQTAFTCYRPLVGRYVYIRRHGWGVLTLCEVEVYGTIGGQDDVKMDNGHPVVFTAKGSHGMWTRQGIHTYMTLFNRDKLQDETSSGLAWETWRNMVYIKYQKNTKRKPYRGNLSWLNFDGAWGNKERACVNLKFKLSLFKKKLVNKNVKQCTLEGGPGSLNSRGAMTNHFPLN